MKNCKTSRIAFVICILALTWALPAAREGAAQQGTEERSIFIPLVLQKHDTGLTWLEPSSVMLEPRPGNAPLAVIDREGRLHLFWDTFTTPRFIYHSMKTGVGWTEPAPVAHSDGRSYILYEPYVDRNGVIHLLWRNWLGSGIEKPHRLLYASFDGGRWSPEEELVRYDYEFSGMVHSGETGEVLVTFTWGLISTHVSQTMRTHSGWSVPVELIPTHKINLVWAGMQGDVHIYAHDLVNDRVRYSYWKNQTWIVGDRVIDGEIYNRKTQLDGQNNLHLYWSGTVPVPGGGVTGLYHQCLEDNSMFWPEETLTGSQAVSGSAARASDQVSQIGLAWKESASGIFRLRTWEGCHSVGVRAIPFPPD
jgi:hypothetical protein